MPIEFTADQLDQLVQTTLPFYIKDKLYAQDEQNTPAMNKFRSGKKMYPGGENIILNARFGRESSWDLITNSDTTLTFSKYNPLRQAKYPWEMNHLGLEFSWQEALRAGFKLAKADDGEFSKVSSQDKIRIQNFLESKFEQLDHDSRYGFSLDRIWSDGTNGFAGVPALITASPSVGVTGSLSRVTNPLWRNRAKAGSNKITASATNQTLTHILRNEMRQLRRYGSGQHVAYCGSLFLEALSIEMTAKGNYSEKGFAGSTTDIGVDGLSLDRMPFVYEPALDELGLEGFCYIVDHQAIKLFMHEGNDMTMHEPKRPHDKLAYYKSLLWSGAMVANRLNSSGIYEVDTANLPSYVAS